MNEGGASYTAARIVDGVPGIALQPCETYDDDLCKGLGVNDFSSSRNKITSLYFPLLVLYLPYSKFWP